jgi:hypothetical protein
VTVRLTFTNLMVTEVVTCDSHLVTVRLTFTLDGDSGSDMRLTFGDSGGPRCTIHVLHLHSGRRGLIASTPPLKEGQHLVHCWRHTCHMAHAVLGRDFSTGRGDTHVEVAHEGGDFLGGQRYTVSNAHWNLLEAIHKRREPPSPLLCQRLVAAQGCHANGADAVQVWKTSGPHQVVKKAQIIKAVDTQDGCRRGTGGNRTHVCSARKKVLPLVRASH